MTHGRPRRGDAAWACSSRSTRRSSLYDEPANLFVAGFIGTPPMNLFRGRILREGDAISGRRSASSRLLVRDRCVRPVRRASGRWPGGMSSCGHALPRISIRAARARTCRLDPGRRRARRGARSEPDGAPPRRRRPGASDGVRGAGVEEQTEEGSRRPNLVASFPPRLDLELGETVVRGDGHRAASTSSTRRPVRRFASAVALVALAVAAGALAGLSVAATGSSASPPSGAALAVLSQPPTTRSIASQRIYFVIHVTGWGGPASPPTQPKGCRHGTDLARNIRAATGAEMGRAVCRVLAGLSALVVAARCRSTPDLLAGRAGAAHAYARDCAAV